MSSRGSDAIDGGTPDIEYVIVNVTDNNVKILEGVSKKFHSLPDHSHSPNAIYAKMKKDGKTLHEMRFYDEKGNPIIEIAYHPEPNINDGNRETNIVHFHLYDGLVRSEAYRMEQYPDIRKKYEKYLKEFNLYDKC